MKRKIYLSVLVLAMSALCLAGCGEDTSANDAEDTVIEQEEDSEEEEIEEEDDATLERAPEVAEAYDLLFNEDFTKIDPKAAYDLVLPLAEAGDPEAQYLVGWIYDYEYSYVGLQQDSDGEGIAFEWYKKAVDGGFVKAYAALAMISTDYVTVNQQEEYALKAFELGMEDMSDEELGTDGCRWLGDLYRYGTGVDIDYAKALEWYEKTSDCRPSALFSIAAIYATGGYGVDKDEEKANEWYQIGLDNYEMLANDGDSTYMYSLGNAYEYGNCNLEIDGPKAVEWYEKAAEQDYVTAIYKLGYLYTYGVGETEGKNGSLSYGENGLEPDRDKAIEWYQKGVELGDSRCMRSLAKLYYNEDDYDNAVKYYSMAADLDDQYAMDWMGFLYCRGYGVELNYETAVEYWTKGADLGNASCMEWISRCYEGGYGVEQDSDKATEWMEKSIEAYGDEAMFEYAQKFFWGTDDVEQDYEKAVYWYEKAANNGYAEAMDMYGYCYINGYGVEVDYDKAREWYERADKLNYPNATTWLGYIYEYAYGVEEDPEKAFEYYTKAAEKDFGPALVKMAECYENGYAVEQDQDKAEEYYQRARDIGYEW